MTGLWPNTKIKRFVFKGNRHLTKELDILKIKKDLNQLKRYSNSVDKVPPEDMYINIDTDSDDDLPLYKRIRKSLLVDKLKEKEIN